MEQEEVAIRETVSIPSKGEVVSGETLMHEFGSRLDEMRSEGWKLVGLSRFDLKFSQTGDGLNSPIKSELTIEATMLFEREEQ